MGYLQGISWGARIRTWDRGTKTGQPHVCSVLNRFAPCSSVLFRPEDHAVKDTGKDTDFGSMTAG
jgi:hypothetical protein